MFSRSESRGSSGSRSSSSSDEDLVQTSEPSGLGDMSKTSLIKMLSRGNRPFKVLNCDRTITKNLTASSLADLSKKGAKKLRLRGDLVLVLEEDGTEVDDEEGFHYIPDHSTVMLLQTGQHWQPQTPYMKAKTFQYENWKPKLGMDECDHGSGGEILDKEMVMLAEDLRQDMASIINFSEDQLQRLVDADTDLLARLMGQTVRFARMVQKASKRRLDEMEKTSEMIALFKLYHRAMEYKKSGKVGGKRKAPDYDDN